MLCAQFLKYLVSVAHTTRFHVFVPFANTNHSFLIFLTFRRQIFGQYVIESGDGILPMALGVVFYDRRGNCAELEGGTYDEEDTVHLEL
jgi:hypothetical protein